MIDYRSPGVFTRLGPLAGGALEGLGDDPVQVCWPVHGLVLQPDDAGASGVPPERLAEKEFRPAEALLARLLAMNPAPLASSRQPAQRVIGTCRHFAVLACALLRARGIASRVRCGFATYFQPGQALDHWVVEHHDGSGRWVRLDPEILGQSVVERPEDLRPGEFLTGAEAWAAYRSGRVDPAVFGVYGTENFGAAEIRGNAVRDLAALNKVEMLPWDEWGRMTDAYEHRTGPDYDELLDELAEVCGGGDTSRIARLYNHPDLAVPERLLS